MFRDGSTKATRILLFLSPLLYFMSPLISVRDSLGLSLVNSFRKGVPGCFPRECLYGVSLLHLRPPIGKRGLAWVAGSLIYPFAAPLVLAFMSPKYGSDADTQRCARFPLLSAYLAPLPPATGLEPRVRLDPVKSNLEFSNFAEPAALQELLAEAAARQFTVWTNPEDSGVRAFRAGIVATPAIEGAKTWLRQSGRARKSPLPSTRPKDPRSFSSTIPSPTNWQT